MAQARPLDPPFRADHVGSLLRPPAVIAARERHARGEIGDDQRRAIEDRAIADAVAMQEEVGLNAITDGEFRRESYFSDFFEHGLGGMTMEVDTTGAWDYTRPDGSRAGASLPRVHDRFRWTGPVNLGDFRTVRSLTRRTPKITLPGPCVIHFFAGRANISTDAYPDLEAFWDDIVTAYHAELNALAAAGCTYVQLDETALAKFGDPRIREALAARGDDWRDLLSLYCGVINRVMAGKPPGLRLGMHLCRGNKRGHWQAEGGYDTVAERLFNDIDSEFYFLEYDTPRAGDFSPLRFLPADKIAVLGLVSTKTPEMETVDDLCRRIDEAASYADLDRLCLSPQCGFASSVGGNPVTAADQMAKLRRVVEVAERVWG